MSNKVTAITSHRKPPELQMLTEDDVTFLNDVLKHPSMHVKRALIEGYTGSHAMLVLKLSEKLAEPEFAEMKINSFIHAKLAEHHARVANALDAWVYANSTK